MAFQTGMAAAASVHITGSWTIIIDDTSLDGGPGGNISSKYTSLPGEVVLKVTGTTPHKHWIVNVSKRNEGIFNWNDNIKLYVKRVGYGDFQRITDTPTFFMFGYDDKDILLQYMIEGVSVNIPPSTLDGYQTLVEYTLQQY
jgi:hypothetical protein